MADYFDAQEAIDLFTQHVFLSSKCVAFNNIIKNALISINWMAKVIPCFFVLISGLIAFDAFELYLV